MSELLVFAKKSGTVFIGRIIKIFLGLLFNFIAARYMGSEAYGQFMYLITFVTLISLISKFGFDEALIYFIPKLKTKNKINRRNSLITFSLLGSFIFSIFISVLIYFNSEFISRFILNNISLKGLLIYFLPIIVLMSILNVLKGVFKGNDDVIYFIKIREIFGNSVRLIFVLIFAILGFRIFGLIYSYYIYLSLICFWLIKNIIQSNFLGKLKLNYLNNYRAFLKFSFPILFSGILSIIVNKTDTFMIGYLLTGTKVGIYNIAYKIAQVSSMVHVSFNMIFPQMISSYYYEKEIEKLSFFYKSLTKWAVIANLISFSVIILCGESLMRLFGMEYIIGANTLIVISLGQIARVGVGAAGYINTMTGKPEYQLYNNLLTAFLNIILNYFLINYLGIIGAAIASFISIGVVNGIRLFLVYRDLNIHPYDFDYIKVFLISVFSVIITFVLKNFLHFNWILEMGILIIFYLSIFSIFYFYFAISENDLFVINKMKSYLGGEKGK